MASPILSRGPTLSRIIRSSGHEPLSHPSLRHRAATSPSQHPASLQSTPQSRTPSSTLTALRLAPALWTRGPSTRCHVSAKDENAEPQEQGMDLTESLASLGIVAFWGAWAAYAFLASPNQTPTIDNYYLQKLVGLKADDGFVLNSVVVSLWNLMGLLPLLYASLLIPASRTTRSKVPAWPFCTLSVAVGAFALLPYFALWKSGDPVAPSEEERKKISSKVFESKITGAALLFGVSGLVLNAATAPAIDWLEFGQIIQQSRLFHVTASDFAVLVLSAPFWVYNDMSYRDWEPRNSWGVALLLIPLLGPFAYLVLRPGLPPAPSSPASGKRE